MQVERFVELLGEVAGEFHVGHAVVAGHFVVRDAADEVAAEVHRAFHQRFAIRESVNAVLRKGDELDVHQSGKFLLHFEQRFDGGKFRVAHIHVAADARDAMDQFPLHRERGATFHVVERERLLAFGPNLNAFDKRTGLIETWLADGEHGVEVDVDIGEWRRDEFAGAVNDLTWRGRKSSARFWR